MEQAASRMQLPPQVRAAMAQIGHLAPAQQQVLFSQIMAHHQRLQQQMSALSQRPPPPPMGAPPHPGLPPMGGMPRPAGADRPKQVPAKVGSRMMGNELQIIMRHQAMQLQIHDPILDDFYHHFWVVKGGRSKAKPLSTRPAVISTERKKTDDEAVGASLGVGAVHHRTPDIAVRTPRKLLAVPTMSQAAGDMPLAAEQANDATATGSGGSLMAPLSAPRWVTRAAIHEARETLIELRVHASSPAVMTPEGQQRRTAFLQRLHALVHHLPNGSAPGAPIGPMNVELFNCEKGRKLLADLLPLWPTPVVCATLHSFLEQLPACLAAANAPDALALADVPALASSLASLPKSLAAEQSASLLEVTATHGPSALEEALKRSDVTALLLGLLCSPGLAESCPAILTAFYAALMPVAATSEAPWALLNALLPVATAAHASLLIGATGTLDAAALSPPCTAAHAAFGTRLQQHVASLAG